MSRSDAIREQVRAATDIVELVGGYVRLRRSGSGFLGLCPFHDEKTPSFNVSPQRGRYKCFGCGKSGDVFSFLMAMESLTFFEALRSLAERAHITLPSPSRGAARTEQYERNDAILRFAARFFEKHFAARSAAVQTFLNERKISPETARAFGLGYAPCEPGKSLVAEALARQYTPEALAEVALAVSAGEEEALRDRFRDRLTVQITTKAGQLLGFAGLKIEESLCDVAVNRELHGLHRMLFGLGQAKGAIAKAEEVYLVSDWTDALAMHQAGFQNVVGTLGTALSATQVQQVRTLAKRMILVDDIRPERMRALTRTVNTVLAGGMHAYVACLPKGLTPFKVLQSDGSGELQSCLMKERKDFVAFLYDDHRQRRAPVSEQWRLEARCTVAVALGHIRDSLVRTTFIAHAARQLGEAEAEIRTAVDTLRPYHVVQFAAACYQNHLLHADYRQQVLQLLESEGVRISTAETFGVGYVPDAWDMLLQEARASGIDEGQLEAADLVRKKQRDDGTWWWWDRFRGCIMLPLQSAEGSVCGLYFAGTGGAQTVRRRQQPVTLLPGKRYDLFGLYACRSAAGEHDEVWIAPTFWDVLVLHSAGLKPVVASAEDAVTPSAMKRLARVAPRLVVAVLEGSAGAVGIIRQAVGQGMGVDVVTVPGEDFSGWVREHGEQGLAACRVDFVTYLVECWRERDRLNDSRALDQAQEHVHSLVERIADEAQRKHYAEQSRNVFEKERIYDVLAFAFHQFREQLYGSSGDVARRYLLDERGLNQDTLDAFDLGYAPERWDLLLKAAMRQGISRGVLQSAGLIKSNEEGTRYYDYFRGRVMFPIHSPGGDFIGFGGRILDSTSKAPKYLNTPETPVYQKRAALYGLYQGLRAAEEVGEFILVEGYTDVLALHQAGIENAVACCGTALTSEQVATMRRFAARVVVLYDADPSGAKAAMQAVALLLEGDMEPYVLTLPSGEDPDSFVRKHGGTDFRAYLTAHRQSLVPFLHAHFKERGDVSSPESRAHAGREVVSYLGRIGDRARRQDAVADASRQFGINAADLEDALADVPVRAVRRLPPVPVARPASRSEPAKQPVRQDRVHPAELELLRLMLLEGTRMISFIMGKMSLEEFSDGLARLLAGALVQMFDDGAVDTDVRNFAAELRDLVAALKAPKEAVSAGWGKRGDSPVAYNEDPEKVAVSAMRLLKQSVIDKKIRETRLKLNPSSGEEHSQAMAELSRLSRMKHWVATSETL